MRGRTGADQITVHCGGCGDAIEAVNGGGKHSEWMHSASRYEACPAGGYARPETVDEMADRHNALRRVGASR